MSDLKEQIRQAKGKARLIEAELRLAALERYRRRLTESYEAWEWLDGYASIIDRMRGPDRDFMLPVSTAADRRHGDNWPFWRTWLEHGRHRAAARLLCGMGTQADGVLGGLCAYVVHQGFKYTASARKGADAPPELVKAVQGAIDDFSKRNAWPELEQELFRRSRRDGEYFLRHFDADGDLAVRVVEPEQVLDAPHLSPEEGKYGVITDADDRERVEAFWVCYDGDAGDGEEVPADEVVHVKVNVDRTVKRGMTDFAFDTHDTIRSAQRLLEAMAEGAAIQASIALVRSHQGSGKEQVEDFVGSLASSARLNATTGRTEHEQRYYPGMIVDMPEGMSYSPTPFGANAQGFTVVSQAVLRAAGVKWNAPEWLISGDASNNNYASSITAESPFVKRCEQFQQLYGQAGVRSVEAAVRARCDAGRLIAGGRAWSWREVRQLVEIGFVAPTVQARNKLQEAQENSVYLQAKIKSPQTVSGEIGLDYDDEQTRIEEHAERTGGLGGLLGLPGPDGEPPDDQGGDDAEAGLGELLGLQESVVPNKTGRGCHDDRTGHPAACHPGKKIGQLYGRDTGVQASDESVARSKPYKVGIGARLEDLAERMVDRVEDSFILMKNGEQTPEEHRDFVRQFGAKLEAEMSATVGRRVAAWFKWGVNQFGDRARRLDSGRQLQHTARKAQAQAAEAVRGLLAGLDEAGEDPGVRVRMAGLKEKLRAIALEVNADVYGFLDEIEQFGHASTYDHLADPKSPEDERDFLPPDRLREFDPSDEWEAAVPEALKGIGYGSEGIGRGYVLDGRPMSKAEAGAVAEYTGDGYRAVNDMLRGAGAASTKAKRLHKQLQGLFGRLKTADRPLPVYRGLSLAPGQSIELLRQLKAAQESGEAVRFAGYSSCTTNPDIATKAYSEGGKDRKPGGSGNDIVFEIACRKGLRIGALSADDPVEGQYSEDEVLLDHDTPLRVAAIREVPFKDHETGEVTKHAVVQLIQEA